MAAVIEVFEDRALRLLVTFQGAGVLHGDLTPECAEIVNTVLDALAVPAGPEDGRDQWSGVRRRIAPCPPGGYSFPA